MTGFFFNAIVCMYVWDGSFLFPQYRMWVLYMLVYIESCVLSSQSVFLVYLADWLQSKRWVIVWKKWRTWRTRRTRSLAISLWRLTDRKKNLQTQSKISHYIHFADTFVQTDLHSNSKKLFRVQKYIPLKQTTKNVFSTTIQGPIGFFLSLKMRLQ